MRSTPGSIVSVTLVAAFVAMAAGDASAKGKNTDAAHERNLGYGQLHELLSDLSDADKLLYVKLETKPVEKWTERLSATAKRLDSRVESFAKEDPGLRIDETGLPEADRRTRQAIRKSRTHELAPLVGKSGADFERTFLLGHQKALDQLRHLTGVVRDLEENERRRAFLAEARRECGALYADVSALLERRYFRNPGAGAR